MATEGLFRPVTGISSDPRPMINSKGREDGGSWLWLDEGPFSNAGYRCLFDFLASIRSSIIRLNFFRASMHFMAKSEPNSSARSRRSFAR